MKNHKLFNGIFSIIGQAFSLNTCRQLAAAKLGLIVIFLLGYSWSSVCIAQTYTPETVPNPKQTRSRHYVSNPDGILSKATVGRIDSILAALEDSTTAQVAVVCLNSIGENVPKDFATALFRKWGLGYQKKNNGLLVLMVKDQRRFELETGYGLEGVLPDAICNQIQTQHMVPFAKAGNYNQAMIAGAEAIASIISKPEVIQEVYDDSKFNENTKPLDDHEQQLTLYLLLWLCWIPFRLLGHWLKWPNPIRKKVETVIAQKKWRLWRAAFLNVVIPIGLIIGGIWLSSVIEPVWPSFLLAYAYIAFIKWDSRQRRRLACTALFGNLPDSAQYVHRKMALANGWVNVLMFPVPLWWLKKEEDQLLDTLRNHPRQSAEGYELTKLPHNQQAAFLTDYQRIEQQLGTVDYDVWYNEAHHLIEPIGYENLKNTTYERCTTCRSKAMSSSGKRVVKEATSEREGRGIHTFTCKACGHQRETTYSIAIIHSQPATSGTSSSSRSLGSSSSWGGSSSGSSSSGSSSSWGGGSSGGGGSGSSW